MKVILIEDVKGRGHQHDIIDVATGYGNFLISQHQAIAATQDNLRIRDYQLAEAQTLESELKEQASKLLQEIKSIGYIIITTEGTPRGTLKKSITKEDVIKHIKAILDSNKVKTDFKLSKTNLKMYPIKTFGIHEIELVLYKDIKSFIQIKVEQ